MLSAWGGPTANHILRVVGEDWRNGRLYLRARNWLPLAWTKVLSLRAG